MFDDCVIVEQRLNLQDSLHQLQRTAAGEHPLLWLLSVLSLAIL